MHQNSRSRPTSPYRARDQYVFPSPLMSSANKQNQHSGPADAALHRNQSVSYTNHDIPRGGLRRTRSFSSDHSSPHISFQPQEMRPPLRFYVDDAIHELFRRKQKSGKSKGSAFSLIAGLFACWNPGKKSSSNAEARSLSASKRVSELLEISRRQQLELADKQDTIDMLEWQLEQMQALALMDLDKETVLRSSSVSGQHGSAVMQNCSEHAAPAEEQKTSTDETEQEKENSLVGKNVALPSRMLKAEEKYKTELHGSGSRPNGSEHPLRDCNFKIQEEENKRKPDVDGESCDTVSPMSELCVKQDIGVSAADKEAAMATLLLFEMATMRARFSIRSFSKALIKQMEASGYSVLRTLSELEPNVAFTKKEHVVYTLESRINKAFFHCFENDSFDDSGLLQILDPIARCAARLEEFQRMKLVEVDDTVNASHPAFEPSFRRFCQRKTKELWSQFSWHIVFNSAEEREGFTAAFLDAAKCVWLLHRLAFSVQPHVQILRVGKGLHIDPVYVDAVPALDVPCGLCGSCKVEFLIMPGFQAMGKVIKCQVYQHVQCLVD
ncbi:hypothetical protein KP509_39G047600 [Ceratopteris richardii]|uniref:Uncharacterized protein n=1 Tax=Ceratopteris richardii TaxID=49495 RepID=A0A8T2Q114_CERRI|nr:hypothetical protein KP509_39G047600 [Ceratopteris richardii]